MSISVCRSSEIEPARLSALDRSLAAYYNSPPASYYTTADKAAANYSMEAQPFHCDLVARVKPGMRLLELGCGTAHLCTHVENLGAHYTGVDYSIGLLEDNRRRFPGARFFPISADLGEEFDFVASLYTIEHVPDPPAYLERMWKVCRPGGLLAVICPEFIDGEGLPPSLFYGHTPRRFREKLRAVDFADAWAHFRDLNWTAPHWLRRARAAPPGAFWINLRPRILDGAPYGIDADAVHFPRLKDLVWWFEHRGAATVQTSMAMRGINREVLRHNCYIVVRKGTE
jgi:SAM-dependent methyltransferase